MIGLVQLPFAAAESSCARNTGIGRGTWDQSVWARLVCTVEKLLVTLHIDLACPGWVHLNASMILRKCGHGLKVILALMPARRGIGIGMGRQFLSNIPIMYDYALILVF